MARSSKRRLEKWSALRDIVESRNGERGAIDSDIVLLVISILILIVFQVYQTIRGGTSTSSLGNLALTMPLIAILIVFLLFSYIVGKYEARFSEVLERRLPPVRYLDTRIEVEAENAKLVERASEFVAAIGGRSRAEEYLSRLENKCQADDVTYWRLLLDGQPITHQVCEHLSKLISLPNVLIATSQEGALGTMLVSESALIIALPMPGHGGLAGISIPGSSPARKVFTYLMVIFPSGTRLTSADDVRALCEECRTVNSQVQSTSQPSGSI